MFACLSAFASSVTYSAHEEKSFIQWMRENNNVFSGDEYQARLGIWLSNKRMVQEHNAGSSSFKVSLNKFAHLTPSEYKAMLGYRRDLRTRAASKVKSVKAADSCDWRDKNVVNAIQDQASCGSCWAFSAIQAQESQYAIATGKLYKLSEQNLVDCVSTCYGCNGGLMDYAYDYVISSQGGQFMLETDYPYKGVDGTCQWDSSKGVTTIKSYINVQEGSETDLAEKVSTYGPAAIAIDASAWAFQLYTSGIYDHSRCSSTNLDHGVGCVGYGTEGSTNYWIVRNSWGTSWGESGYIRMVKDKNNQCGEATEACIPVDQ